MISLHAIGAIGIPENPTTKAQALYLEIVATDGFDDHDQEGTITLNVLPQSTPESAPSDNTNSDTPAVSTCQQLYDAVTACANLHPDPVSPSSSQAEGEEEENDEDQPAFDYEVLGDDGMPAAFPGSGGWITSENMDQFFDEEGNWRGRGLGPGAGLARSRDDIQNGVNGDGEAINSDDESKWRRTG